MQTDKIIEEDRDLFNTEFQENIIRQNSRILQDKEDKIIVPETTEDSQIQAKIHQLLWIPSRMLLITISPK